MWKVLLIVFTFSVMCGCDEEDPEQQLTPITNTGAGGFSCKVNGDVWKANIEGLFYIGLPYTYSIWQKDSVEIYARRNKPQTAHIESKTEILFHLLNVNKTGTYVLNATQSYAEYGIYNDSLPYPNHIKYIRTDETYNGSITIHTFDTTKHIVAGTFAFKIKKPDGTVLKFTDGRFDFVLGGF